MHILHYCIVKRSRPTGRAKKVTPRKNSISLELLWFFLQINSGYRGDFRLHILQISLQYLLAFQNYTYLNLNMHFFKVNK